MLVLGKIKTINNDNTCTVHAPVFDTAGLNVPTYMTATFSITPGFYNNYAIGDVVYIGFENNVLDDPIILGKLYTGITNEDNRNIGAINSNSLKILGKAELPTNTTIGGITWQDLVNYGNRLTKIECNPGLSKTNNIKDIVYNCLPKSISKGKLVNPITISGGDGTVSNKLILDQNKLGQITDSGTSTLLGFIQSTTLTVGHTSYILNLRGKNTRPTYNNKELALLSDTNTTEQFNVKNSSIPLKNQLWINNKQIYASTFVINDASQNYLKNSVTFPILAGTTFDFSLDLAKAIKKENLDYDYIWLDQSHTLQIGTNYNFNSYCFPDRLDYFMPYINKIDNEIHIKGKALENINEFIVVINYTYK